MPSSGEYVVPSALSTWSSPGKLASALPVFPTVRYTTKNWPFAAFFLFDSSVGETTVSPLSVLATAKVKSPSAVDPPADADVVDASADVSPALASEVVASDAVVEVPPSNTEVKT